METARRSFLRSAATGAAAVAALGRRAARAGERNPNRLAGLDRYITAAKLAWKLPGLAVAVVEDGQLIFARGYGARALPAGAAVDVDTVFPIASCSKSFTAAAIAKLVDGAKLQWDDPLAKHLPSLVLSESGLASRITIRQALTHRAGLPAANMLWRSGAFGGAEILARLRWLQPVAAPGEQFIYNNNLYLVLGKIVERVSGRKWNDVLQTELFDPLEMKSTFADGSNVARLDNVAAPHATVAGSVRIIERYCPDVVAPAGAIHSNVIDMAHWLMLHLQGSQFKGRQVLSPTRLQEMHVAPQRAKVAQSGSQQVPSAPIGNYGLGWFFNDHAGRRVVEHSGTQNGFVSWVAMMPQERLGLVVLANHDGTGLNYALRSWIFDALLGRPERDWSEIVRADYANGYERLLREAKAQFEAKRTAGTRPSQPLTAYSGVYESKLYGPLRVTAQGDQLALRFGSRFSGELKHWQDDAFRATFANPMLHDWLITFALQDGRISALRVQECPWAPAWYDDADDLGEFERG